MVQTGENNPYSCYEIGRPLWSPYLLNISGRPDRFFKDTRVKQEALMKPVRSLPQVIEMLLVALKL